MRALNILVAEDNDAIRRGVCGILSAFNPRHGIVDAENGLIGLVEFTNGDFDLVITDLNMPVMNGYALIRTVKEERPTVVTILITADPIDANSVPEADVVLYKPVTADTLKEEIEKFFPDD